MVQPAGMRGLVKRQPTVVSAMLGVRSQALPGLSTTYGARVMLSTPPATKTSPSPARIAWAALAAACSPEPQSRFTVCPGTSTGRPARSAAMRATLRLSSPAWLAQPRITSSIRSAGRAGAVEQAADGRRGEIVGPDLGQRAAGAADRGADGVEDVGVGHGGSMPRAVEWRKERGAT